MPLSSKKLAVVLSCSLLAGSDSFALPAKKIVGGVVAALAVMATAANAEEAGTRDVPSKELIDSAMGYFANDAKIPMSLTQQEVIRNELEKMATGQIEEFLAKMNDPEQRRLQDDDCNWASWTLHGQTQGYCADDESEVYMCSCQKDNFYCQAQPIRYCNNGCDNATNACWNAHKNGTLENPSCAGASVTWKGQLKAVCTDDGLKFVCNCGGSANIFCLPQNPTNCPPTGCSGCADIEQLREHNCQCICHLSCHGCKHNLILILIT